MAVGLVLLATAAPIPPRGPESEGPISDFLRLRSQLPQTPPPRIVQVGGDREVFEVHRTILRYVPETRVTTVVEDGKMRNVTTTVSIPVQTTILQRVALKDCKYFAVARGGKLDAVEAGKAMRMLRKPTSVLVSDSPEVDPRYLELVEGGTLYLVLPPPSPARMPREPEVLIPPGEGKK
jgi:hypothetical protein